MKKVIASLLFIVILTFSVVTVSANETAINQYSFNEIGVDITFEEDNSLTEEQKARIAEILAYDLTPAETRAWCWLTGHDYQYDYVASVHHRVLEKAPRCEQTNYEVETCSKCDHLEYTVINSYYITCCPEE